MASESTESVQVRPCPALRISRRVPYPGCIYDHGRRRFGGQSQPWDAPRFTTLNQFAAHLRR
jgi:hypothetical protein